MVLNYREVSGVYLAVVLGEVVLDRPAVPVDIAVA
jgi:hypothetical protein